MLKKLNKLLLEELAKAMSENRDAYPDKATLVNVMHPNSLRRSVVGERDYIEAVKRLEKEYGVSVTLYNDMATELYTILKTQDAGGLELWIRVLRKQDAEKPNTTFGVFLDMMLDIQQHLQKQERGKDEGGN